MLVPGGACIVSFFNHCFPTKAVRLWQGMGDAGHLQQVEACFHCSGAFEAAEWVDLSPAKGRSDPLYEVQPRVAVV